MGFFWRRVRQQNGEKSRRRFLGRGVCGGGREAGKAGGERDGRGLDCVGTERRGRDGRRSRRAAPVADGVAHGGEAPTDGAVLVERRVLRAKSSGAQKREGARGERAREGRGEPERTSAAGKSAGGGLAACGATCCLTPGSGSDDGIDDSGGALVCVPASGRGLVLVEKAAGHEKRPGKRRAPASFIKEGPVRENPVKERRFYLEPPACSRPRFFSSTSRQASAAGVTPEMRPACPSVRGRMAESFSCISRESPEMPS